MEDKVKNDSFDSFAILRRYRTKMQYAHSLHPIRLMCVCV